MRVDGAAYAVSFRVPRAADVEAAGVLHDEVPGAAEAELLERCIRRAARDGASVPASHLPEPVQQAVTEAIADHDPQAQIVLRMACPACGRDFSVTLDAAAFLLDELDTRVQRLVWEVYALATHYHWSERDILELPAGRRERYLELVVNGPVPARAR